MASVNGEAVPARDVADDRRILEHAAISPRVGCRADDHGDVEPARRQQHQLEVVPLPLLGATRLVGAQGLGADVAAPGVRDDGIGPTRHADIEAAPLDGREPEMARR